MINFKTRPLRRIRVGSAVRLTQATTGPFKELSGVGRQIGG